MDDPGVFKKPVHHAADLDMLGKPGHAGPQPAEAADQQPDPDAGLARVV